MYRSFEDATIDNLSMSSTVVFFARLHTCIHWSNECAYLAMLRKMVSGSEHRGRLAHLRAAHRCPYCIFYTQHAAHLCSSYRGERTQALQGMAVCTWSIVYLPLFLSSSLFEIFLQCPNKLTVE